MLLCLDVGNTHILGGIFEQNKLLTRFRYATQLVGTADQFGMFLFNYLTAHEINGEKIKATAICSVVPSLDFTIKHAISLYLSSSDYYVLQSDVSGDLQIKIKNPAELGADSIADAIGAIAAYPRENIIIIDMGTATALCAINRNHHLLGVSILPGMRLSMESLSTRTAKLMEVDIESPTVYLGRTTQESIRSGLYYGQLGALKEIIAGIKREVFADEPVVTIGTGGFAQLFRNESLFDVILPDLVLQGLCKAYEFSKK
jgi:type III pantothenate kinase